MASTEVGAHRPDALALQLITGVCGPREVSQPECLCLFTLWRLKNGKKKKNSHQLTMM